MTPGFKRLLAVLVILVVLCTVHFLTGCATNANRLRYTQETEELNILETIYMAKYKAADFDTQIQWRYQVDPQLKKARFALFSWDVAMAVNEDGISLEKERFFYMVKKKFTCFFSEKN